MPRPKTVKKQRIEAEQICIILFCSASSSYSESENMQIVSPVLYKQATVMSRTVLAMGYFQEWLMCSASFPEQNLGTGDGMQSVYISFHFV